MSRPRRSSWIPVLVQALDLHFEGFSTGYALLLLYLSNVVDSAKFPFKGIILNLEHKRFASYRDFRDELWPFRDVSKNVFVRPGLESVLKLGDGLCTIDYVIKDFVHRQSMRYGESDKVRGEIDRLLNDETTMGFPLEGPQVDSNRVHAHDTCPSLSEMGSFGV